MSKNPRITVAISTFNRKDRLKLTIDSVLAQDYDNFGLVVSDGGSKDGTPELLESYGGRITKWLSKPDSGEYEGFNRATAMCEGDIIKWLPDDDRLRPGALQTMADHFVANPDADFIWGQAATWHDDGNKEPYILGHSKPIPSRDLTVRNIIRQLTGLNSVALFASQKAVERLGPFRLDMKCGDIEYWARAASQGCKFVVVDDLVVDYYVTGENGWITMNRKIALNMVRVAKMYGTPADIAHVAWKMRMRLLGYHEARQAILDLSHKTGTYRALKRVQAMVGGR